MMGPPVLAAMTSGPASLKTGRSVTPAKRGFTTAALGWNGHGTAHTLSSLTAGGNVLYGALPPLSHGFFVLPNGVHGISPPFSPPPPTPSTTLYALSLPAMEGWEWSVSESSSASHGGRHRAHCHRLSGCSMYGPSRAHSNPAGNGQRQSRLQHRTGAGTAPKVYPPPYSVAEPNFGRTQNSDEFAC